MSGRKPSYTAKTSTACTKEVSVKGNVGRARLISIGLIVTGLALVFLAVPFWLWAMLLGIVLILVGFFLLIGD